MQKFNNNNGDYAELVASIRNIAIQSKQQHLVAVWVDAEKMLMAVEANRPTKKTVRAMWSKYNKLYLRYVCESTSNVR